MGEAKSAAFAVACGIAAIGLAGCADVSGEAPPADLPAREGDRAPVAMDPAPAQDGPPNASPAEPSAPAAAPATDQAAGSTAFAWDEAQVTGPTWAVRANALLAACADAGAKLAALEVPAAFVDEGKAPTDPARVKSAGIWRTLEDVMPHLGYCARIVNHTQAASRAAIVAYVKKLATTYVGGTDANPTSDDDDPGNPVNEVHLLPVVFAIDMIHAELIGADLTFADGLLSGLELRVAKFMSALSASDTRRVNNWQTRALTLRAAGALVRGATATAKAQELAAAIDQHVADVFVTPAGWKLSSCMNLASIGAYGSANLQRTDSLESHLQPILQLVRLSALRPGYLSPASQASLASGLAVLQPYATGAKTHSENVCGTGSVLPWNPANATVALRFARLAVPAVKPWTDSFAKTPSHLWLDVLAAGKGDVTP